MINIISIIKEELENYYPNQPIISLVTEEIIDYNNNPKFKNYPFPEYVNDIANNLMIEPYNKSKYILSNVNVELADAAFKRDIGYYIGKNDKGLGNRRENIRNIIVNGDLKYAPIANISLDKNNNQPILSFTDGRHRFAELRDNGAQNINISFSKESIKYIPLLQQKNIDNTNDNTNITNNNNVLNEIGEANLKTYEYTEEIGNNESHYHFKTEDNDMYNVLIYKDNQRIFYNYNVWIIEFNVLLYNHEHISYVSVINKGRLYNVMSTITKISKEAINKYKPDIIYLHPSKNDDNDPRRLHLYQSFINKNTSGFNYKIFNDDNYILIINNDFLNNNNNNNNNVLTKFIDDIRIRLMRVEGNEAELLKFIYEVIKSNVGFNVT